MLWFWFLNENVLSWFLFSFFFKTKKKPKHIIKRSLANDLEKKVTENQIRERMGSLC